MTRAGDGHHHDLIGGDGAGLPGFGTGTSVIGYGASFWLSYEAGAFGGVGLALAGASAGAASAPGSTGTMDTAPMSLTATNTSLVAAGTSSPFVINISYDSSVTNLQTSNPSLYTLFTTSVNAAVSFFESQFTNAMSITINVGYGEVGGTTLASNALGESQSSGMLVTYRTLYDALSAAAQAPGASASMVAAFNSLPASDPTGGTGHDYYVPYAEATALGLIGAPAGAVGSIGISSVYPMAYGSTNQAVSGRYDAVGVIEHEISEVLGRIGSLGTYTGAGIYTLLDLFRYSSAGVRDLTPGAGYFSIDNGATNLVAFNNPTSGGDAADLAATNPYSPNSFNNASAAGVANTVTATDLTMMNALGYSPPPCYAAGTRILTARGEVPVESLAIGDQVRTRFAGLAPVRWIGHRRVDCHRHPDPAAIRPVRVTPDAFGPGQPARELLLSPEHAVELDGALVPIRLLINRGSIAQDTTCAHVHYFHVELDRHDILFAEGMPAESYLDTGNRAIFENAGEPLRLHPRFDDPDAQARREANSCLPLLCDPVRLEMLWRRLADRSAALGFRPRDIATTDDPALCLTCGGQRVAPVARTEDTFTFVVPPGAGAVRLLSRVAVPADRQPWCGDWRRLGVMVQRLTLRRGAARIDIALDDPRLRDGWWDAESDGATIWRWTDGAAMLPVPDEPAVLEVWTGDRLAYPLTPSVEPGRRDAAPPSRRRA